MDKRIVSSGSSEWNDDKWSDAVEDDDFKSLTREQAMNWRQRQPIWSPWRVVRWQWLLSALAAILAGLFMANRSVGWSVWYGGLSVALPTTLMAHGVTRRSAGNAQASLAVLFFWEGAKVLMVLAMLWSAPRWVPELSWLGLLAGLVVALKAYWVVWILSLRAERQGN